MVTGRNGREGFFPVCVKLQVECDRLIDHLSADHVLQPEADHRTEESRSETRRHHGGECLRFSHLVVRKVQ